MCLAGIIRPVLIVAAMLAVGAQSPAIGQRRPLTMLDQLTDGRWELRIRGDSNIERICLEDGRRLIQLRHPEQPCESLVVEDLPNVVTVQYTCRGRGYGRTQIRRENNLLVQVQSQGIAGGLPFDFTAEGRRVGNCSS